jgi:hypothetical protein
MDIAGIVIGAALVWTLLIAAWWSFWLWYGGGALQPTSWSAILTMPIWSVRSVWEGYRRRQRRCPAEGFEQLHDQLRAARAAPPADPQERRQLAEHLENALQKAPPGLPAAVRADMAETIRILREDS